jgi:ferric-dicitrate binding protein FerR (iron transport regulator)
VAKDSLHPFSIRAEGLDVRVVGTKFNLFARKGVALSRLSLEEGKVLFTSLASHRQTAVWPGQVAVLDKQTGRISVEQKPEEVNDATAWQRNELVFRNATLRHVIAVMETTYGVKFRFSGRLNMDDIFTGTLPSNNLGEGLEIIRHSYHVRAEQRNGVVTITK